MTTFTTIQEVGQAWDNGLIGTDEALLLMGEIGVEVEDEVEPAESIILDRRHAAVEQAFRSGRIGRREFLATRDRIRSRMQALRTV